VAAQDASRNRPPSVPVVPAAPPQSAGADGVLHPDRQLQHGRRAVSLPLIAGSNTIEFANATSYAPDFDRIILAATPG
jgi:hypothetical protein